MDNPTCQSCIHFLQHYVLDAQSCTPINCGHCRYPRLKHREPQTRACAHYQPRTTSPDLPDRDRAIHYLTAEFLQFILNHDLPPEMK